MLVEIDISHSLAERTNARAQGKRDIEDAYELLQAELGVNRVRELKDFLEKAYDVSRCCAARFPLSLLCGSVFQANSLTSTTRTVSR